MRAYSANIAGGTRGLLMLAAKIADTSSVLTCVNSPLMADGCVLSAGTSCAGRRVSSLSAVEVSFCAGDGTPVLSGSEVDIVHSNF
jgi:hypothetical protein